VGAVPGLPAWYIAYLPCASRERHIQYVLSLFLLFGGHSAPAVTVIDALHMQMLGVFLILRQVIHHTLSLGDPYSSVQVRLVLLRMGEPALLRGWVFPHCCNQFWQFGPSDLIVEFRVMRTGFGLSATTTRFGNSKFGSNQRVGKDYIILVRPKQSTCARALDGPVRTPSPDVRAGCHKLNYM
jgi:hypothetical protein